MRYPVPPPWKSRTQHKLIRRNAENKAKRKHDTTRLDSTPLPLLLPTWTEIKFHQAMADIYVRVSSNDARGFLFYGVVKDECWGTQTLAAEPVVPRLCQLYSICTVTRYMRQARIVAFTVTQGPRRLVFLVKTGWKQGRASDSLEGWSDGKVKECRLNVV
jgi:hypothetical protein